MIYLDNAATTQIHPEVLDAMMPYLKDEYGNAGTMYGLGRRAANAVAEARKQVSGLIGCEPNQIVFTSGGSEANNLVFTGLLPYLAANNKTHIITSSVEHDSVLKAVQNLCEGAVIRCATTPKMCIKDGFYATHLSVNSHGEVNPNDIDTSITDNTGLVSVMYVNNETGACNPVHKIGDVCTRKRVLFHTDCVQAAGHEPINVDKVGCDFLSISSHKIHGPKGIGALFVRDFSLLSPMIYGGAEQEFGYRGGTENVAGIVGFGKACEITLRNFKTSKERIDLLRASFELKLKQELSRNGLDGIMHINSPSNSGKILNVRFDRVDGQTLLLMLDSRGVCVSAGSACRSYESEPSHVLIATGLNPDEARDSIRISFSSMQSDDEVLASAGIIANCVAALRTNVSD